MKRLLLSLTACSMMWTVSNAQQEICGHKEYLDRQIQQDPSLLKRIQEFDQFAKDYAANYQVNKTQGTNPVVTIPVVFHVVYKNVSENLPIGCFTEQIQQLNRDFRYLNTDKSNIPSVFAAVATDCEIEFCLAQRDPQGQATTGVTYTSTADPSFTADDQVKYAAQGGHDIWDPNQYLNVWVCDISGNVLGYGLFPGANPARDGVVVDYTAVGTSCSSFPYDMGRTLVHEVGHWLGLRHIWGDANCGDDFITDTPTQQTQNAGNPTFPHVTCGNSPNGDMFMNYMDYSDHASLLMFTVEQKKRMHAALAGPRKAIMNSNACAPPTSNKPVANFSTATPKVLLGSSVSFFDQSLNGPTSWSWTFTGAATTSSTSQNPSGVIYNTLGCFPVTLVATNANGSDTKTKICYVNVVKACDTLSNIYQGDSVVYYGSDNWGYMTGHNGYGVTAIADKFTNPSGGSYKMEGVYIGVAYSKYSNSAKTVNVKVYDANGLDYNNATGAPGTQLGTTTATYSELGYGRFFGEQVYVRFASPVTVTNPFYVSVEFTYAAGDTLALLGTKFRSNQPATAWEKWADGKWHPFSQTDWWNSKFSMVYNPVLCDQLTSIENQVPFSHLISVYPNPGSGLFTVGFGFESAKNVTLNVYNLIGENVYNEQLYAMPGSSRQVNLNELPDGVYLMEVRTENNSTTQKIILQH